MGSQLTNRARPRRRLEESNLLQALAYVELSAKEKP
jgi:hypothetical protein